MSKGKHSEAEIIGALKTGGPDVSLEDELGCPTCRTYTWVFASLTFLLPESCR
jgi:hypothetical protein